MNKVVCVNRGKELSGRLGSIWKSDASGELFILAGCASNEYVAISLKWGNRWRDSAYRKEDATRGLSIVFESAEITVEEKKD